MPLLKEALEKAGSVYCRIPGKETKALFTQPEYIVSTENISDISDCVRKVEEFTAKGFYAAGFISYEASPAFDKALKAKAPGTFPLLWFGIYSSFEEFNENTAVKIAAPPILSPEIEEKAYLDDVSEIKDFIYEGDIYQANYTFRSRGKASADPAGLFLKLSAAHPVPYSAYVNTGKVQIISLSPELFLERTEADGRITSKPMKGTAKRAYDSEADLKNAELLRNDIKNQAENLMIVDMVRNDMGRICVPGSIRAEALFEIETYMTVHQMTSTVSGLPEAGTGFFEILKSLFPAASITGAPKVRATEIIAELEKSPRKIYTGTAGCLSPAGKMLFNVAIRTMIFAEGMAELGIGSGIVADSSPECEWEECLLKSGFSNSEMPDFEILETILLNEKNEYVCLSEHLRRAGNSQIYFGRKWNESEAKGALDKLKKDESCKRPARVRLLAEKNGKIRVESQELKTEGWGKDALAVKLSSETTNSQDLFLYHKTTKRDLYNRKFREAQEEGFDEIIFMNEKGFISEGAISNIFIFIDKKWFTPVLSCGLLPGIWRADKMKELNALESIISLEKLLSAEKVLIGNSVRGGAFVKKIIQK